MIPIFSEAGGGSGPVAGFALVAHSVFSGGITGGSAGAINATGASLIAVATGSVAILTFTVGDNFGNTYVARSDTQNANNRSILWTCENPTVGPNLIVTITSGFNVFVSMCVAAFSGSLQPTSFDSTHGGTGTTSAINTGNITPSINGELILTTLVQSAITASPPTIATIPAATVALTIVDSVNFNNGVSYGSALAWGTLPVATTFSVTWTEAAAPVNNNAANVACFKGLV